MTLTLGRVPGGDTHSMSLMSNLSKPRNEACPWFFPKAKERKHVSTNAVRSTRSFSSFLRRSFSLFSPPPRCVPCCPFECVHVFELRAWLHLCLFFPQVTPKKTHKCLQLHKVQHAYAVKVVTSMKVSIAGAFRVQKLFQITNVRPW